MAQDGNSSLRLFPTLVRLREELQNELAELEQIGNVSPKLGLRLKDPEEYASDLEAFRSVLGNPLRVLFLGNLGLWKTTLAQRLVAPTIIATGPTRVQTKVHLAECGVIFIDTAGVNPPPDDPRLQASRQTFDALCDVHTVVLLLKTPHDNDQALLIQRYKAARHQKLRSLDCALIWSPPEFASAREEVRSALLGAQVVCVGVCAPADIDAAAGWLCPALDGMLSNWLQRKVNYPQLELPEDQPSEKPPRIVRMKESLGLAHQKLTDLEQQQQRINQTREELRKGIDEDSRKLAALDRDLTELRAQQRQLNEQRNDVGRFEESLRSNHDGGCWSQAELESESARICLAGWSGLNETIRVCALGEPGTLDLLQETQAAMFLQAAHGCAQNAGNRYLEAWLLGTSTSSPPDVAPSVCLHNVLCQKLQQNYTWAKKQWQTLRLPANRAPGPPENLQQQIKAVLDKSISLSMTTWSDNGLQILLQTAAGVVGGAAAGTGVGLLIAKIVAAGAFIDGGIITGFAAALAVAAGALVNRLSRGRRRQELEGVLKRELREALVKALAAYQPTAEQSFRAAGAAAYQLFLTDAQGTIAATKAELDRQIRANGEAIEQRKREECQLREKVADSLVRLRVEGERISRDQDELRKMVRVLTDRLAGYTRGGKDAAADR